MHTSFSNKEKFFLQPKSGKPTDFSLINWQATAS
jgi:hypothetical protein